MIPFMKSYLKKCKNVINRSHLIVNNGNKDKITSIPYRKNKIERTDLRIFNKDEKDLLLHLRLRILL